MQFSACKHATPQICIPFLLAIQSFFLYKSKAIKVQNTPFTSFKSVAFMLTFWMMRTLVLLAGAMLLVVFCVGARARPEVTIVSADSNMEDKLVQNFKDEGYSEVSLDRLERRVRNGRLRTFFRCLQ